MTAKIEALKKINTKNEYILKLITDYSRPSADRTPTYSEVVDICDDIFKIAKSNFENIEKLTQVMEVVYKNSNRLSGESQHISKLTNEENMVNINFDLETLDYQLNVKEANRIASRVSEISEELKTLAETAVSEE
jgi:hypothetical protein